MSRVLADRTPRVRPLDEDSCSKAWSAFTDAAPSLCYIGKTRELLLELVDISGDLEDLVRRLEHAMAETESPSFRTDLKILKQRLDWWCRKGTRKG